MEHQNITRTTRVEPQKGVHAVTEQAPWTQGTTHPVLYLQRMIGNQGVQRLIQAKLKVDQPFDRPEQEADWMANQVLSVGATKGALPLQRKCGCDQQTIAGGECEECRQKRGGIIQRISVGAAPMHAVPPIVYDVLSLPGQALDPATRTFMEPRFGQDFSQVRVHTDTKAAESAKAVSALAYTVGRDVVFGAGQYAPGTGEGRRLMAHELTHVVQQERSHLKPIQRHHYLQRQIESSGGSLTPWDTLPSNARQKIDKTYFNQNLDQEEQSAFRSVYSELVAEGLWNFVGHVDKVIIRNVRGIEASSQGDLAGRLRSSSYFCSDTKIGGSLHPGEKTWRQIVQTATEGLHIGVGQNHMTAHLDVLAPVSGREPDGTCRYSASEFLPHTLRDYYGLRSNESFQTAKTVFDRFNEALKMAQELSKGPLTNSIDRREVEDANRQLNFLIPYIQLQSTRGIPGRREAEQKVGDEVAKIWVRLKQIHDRIQGRRLDREAEPF